MGEIACAGSTDRRLGGSAKTLPWLVVRGRSEEGRELAPAGGDSQLRAGREGSRKGGTSRLESPRRRRGACAFTPWSLAWFLAGPVSVRGNEGSGRDEESLQEDESQTGPVGWALFLYGVTG